MRQRQPVICGSAGVEKRGAAGGTNEGQVMSDGGINHVLYQESSLIHSTAGHKEVEVGAAHDAR